MRTASYLIFLFLVAIGRFIIPSQETVPHDIVEDIFAYAAGNTVVEASLDECSLKVEIYHPKACRSEFSAIRGQDYFFNFKTARDILVLRRSGGSLIQFLPYKTFTGAISLQSIQSSITTNNCDGSIERDDTPDIKSIYLFQSLSDKEVHLLSISVRSCHLSKKICPQGSSMDDTIIGAVVPFKLSALGARPIEFGLSA